MDRFGEGYVTSSLLADILMVFFESRGFSASFFGAIVTLFDMGFEIKLDLF